MVHYIIFTGSCIKGAGGEQVNVQVTNSGKKEIPVGLCRDVQNKAN